MTYREQLRDVRWQKLRLEALAAAGWKCRDCGGSDFLNVHHRRYVAGRAPWEYPLDDLKVLCEGCHRKIHGLVSVPDGREADEGQHWCGDWTGENWRRDGATFFVNGIPFELVRWNFIEDGMYGAIYFAVSDLIFEVESNSGASCSPIDQLTQNCGDDGPPDYPAVDAHGVPIGAVVRCATPCMVNGENFMPFPMEWIIFGAAQFALDNLTRKKD